MRETGSSNLSPPSFKSSLVDFNSSLGGSAPIRDVLRTELWLIISLVVILLLTNFVAYLPFQLDGVECGKDDY